MGMLTLDISMSLDGFVAGPSPSLEHPLGEGGERLHEWVVAVASWCERHGLAGGETNGAPELESTRVVESPTGVAHLRYRVGR
jgi:hypothetical protein